jgi:SAM-dependent methyltransferase
MEPKKKMLDVGGHDRNAPLPRLFADYEHHLLDIDPSVHPDILLDARELKHSPPGVYDAVYSSHCLEHFYTHDVPTVLSGIHHVLKEDGFAVIRVPDILLLMRTVAARNLEIDDVIFQSPDGPIMVLDVLYGWTKVIAETGVDFYAHKTGFSHKTLRLALEQAGFREVLLRSGPLEIAAIAFKTTVDPEVIAGFRP